MSDLKAELLLKKEILERYHLPLFSPRLQTILTKTEDPLFEQILSLATKKELLQALEILDL